MSQGKTRTILEELNSISVDRNKHHVLENRVEHLVSGVENVKKIQALLQFCFSDNCKSGYRKIFNHFDFQSKLKSILHVFRAFSCFFEGQKFKMQHNTQLPLLLWNYAVNQINHVTIRLVEKS